MSNKALLKQILAKTDGEIASLVESIMLAVLRFDENITLAEHLCEITTDVWNNHHP